MSAELVPGPGKVPATTELTFRHYSAHVINANDSRGAMADMLDAGIAAAQLLRARAETEFRINIEVEGGLNTQKIALKAYRRFLAIAVACRNAKKPVAELTEEEKFAICVACDVPCKSEGGNALLLKLETRSACAIVWEDGQYVVYYAKG